MGTASGGVVCSFAGCNALGDTGAELFRGLGAVLCVIVGHECGDWATGAGQGTNTGADNGGTADNALELPYKAPTGEDLGNLLGLDSALTAVVNLTDKLRKTEETDESGNLVKAAVKLNLAEAESGNTAELVHANEREEEAQHGSGKTVDNALCGGVCNNT